MFQALHNALSLSGRSEGMNASSLHSGSVKLVRTLTAILAAMVLASYGAQAGESAPPRERRPANVLLVSIDTLRADYLREATFLSRLAEEGRAFSKVYSSSNWTLPSHVSLLSSLPYFEHNVPAPRSTRPFLDSRMPADQPTLASVLLASGYATAASTEGGFVVPHYGLEKGFESFETVASPASGNQGSPGEHLAFARNFIRRNESRPFFLFVHTYVAHDYLVNSELYHELLTPEDAPYVEYGNLIERKKSNRPLPPAAFIKRLYTAGVRGADRLVAELIGAVRKETRDAPLLVVLTSDHGESLGEHPGQFGHGSCLNDVQTRIPLVVWTNAAPLLHGGVDSLVSTIDVAPSVVRWLGLRVPEKFRGRDDLLQPSPGPRASPVLIQQNAQGDASTVGPLRHALIWSDWKYLRSDRFDGTNVSETCYPIPQLPESEPKWGEPMRQECMSLREWFARSLESPPQGSFTLEGNRPVEMQLGRSANGSVLAAVFSAYPSTGPILFSKDGVVSWLPPAGGAWLVGYTRDSELIFSSIAVGGRTRVKDVRLGDLEATVRRPGRTEASDGFSVRTRGLDEGGRAPAVSPGLRERLRALGYYEDK